MYLNKTTMAKVFRISRQTVWKHQQEIEQEIGKRYNRYAVLEDSGAISVEVFADYEKYRKRLKDRNLRKTVPPFSMAEAREYLLEEGLLHIECKKISAVC